ncbi:MAG: class F420-dependent oxidoreductase, partial [Actinotalea sp.]|nr:class F420-dependent oxidoreductase [Actinotalea sp.]
YREGRRAEAAAAVPTALIEDIALIGPPAAVKDRLAQWKDTVVTSILVQGDATALRAVADLLG